MRADFEEHIRTFSECKERPGRSGPQLLTRDCPFCGDDRWHLYVGKFNGLWKCFHCQRTGSYLQLAAAFTGIPAHEAARTLRGLPPRRAPRHAALYKLKGLLDAMTWDGMPETNPVEVPLPSEYMACRLKGGWRVPKPVRRRHFKKQTLADFGIGYCLTGRYRNRIVIPIVTGTYHAFQARGFDKRMDPKYLSPVTDMSRLLFGEPWLGPRLRFVVVVEGAFDVMRLREHGFPAAATMGKTVSEAQARILAERTDSIFLLHDGDDDDAAETAWESIKVLRPVMRRVRVAASPPGKDPDDCTSSEVRVALREAVDGGTQTGGLRGRLAAMRSL